MVGVWRSGVWLAWDRGRVVASLVDGEARCGFSYSTYIRVRVLLCARRVVRSRDIEPLVRGLAN